MKIYTKIILDKNYNILEEKYFEYNGPLWHCGIHYDFKSTRSAKLMDIEDAIKELQEMSVKELKSILQERDLPVSGNKTTMIERIVDSLKK